MAINENDKNNIHTRPQCRKYFSLRYSLKNASCFS